MSQQPEQWVCHPTSGLAPFTTTMTCGWEQPPATVQTVCGWQNSQLPDGDVINILSECCVDGAKVGISLEVADDVTWWKGLKISDGQSLQLQGRGESLPNTPWLRVGPMNVNVAQLPSRFLTLSKAKQLGIHRDVYLLNLSELAPYFGRNVVFQWRLDSGNTVFQPDPLLATSRGQPLDGTLLAETNGMTWVVFGEAGFLLPDAATQTRLFPGKSTLPVSNGAPESELRFAPKDGTLLRDDSGSVWAIFGSAKFHVPDPTTFSRFFPTGSPFSLWNGAVNKIPDIPVDGTVFRDDSGTFWAVAGKAKFALPDAATLFRLFPNGATPIWNAALSQIPAIPMDGTLLREDDGTVWVIYGKAKFHVPDPATYTRLFGQATPFQLWNTAVVQIPDIPVDGTVFRDEDNYFWVIAGTAKFRVPDSTTHDLLYPGAPILHIWNGALSQLPDIPVDNTLLREQNGAIWAVIAKAKFHVPDPTTFNRFFGNTSVFQVWDGAVSTIPDVPPDGTAWREESSSQVYVIRGGHKYRTLLATGTVHVVWDGALSQIPIGILHPIPLH